MMVKVVSPGGYLMPLSAAAKELGLEPAELLEYAEELDGGGVRLRVCVMPTEAQAGFERLRPLTGNVGSKVADRGYMVIDPEGQPGFFRSLARNGRGWLGNKALQERIDELSKTRLVNPGRLANRLVAVEVQLEGLMVPREDIEALKADEDRTNEDQPPRHERELLLCIGTLAKLLAEHAPTKLQFAGKKSLPYNATKIGEAVHRECGRLNPKTVAGWLGEAKKLLESKDDDE